MSKTRKKKNTSNKKTQRNEVRLSQCMIVKNEEHNIERALSWGKDVVYEQIVVDTGSTDRTVEIAESMGAKVYHFEWIDDFSAAKNYALEQATGNWIAFLDADEYFTDEYVPVLMNLLDEIENSASGKKYIALQNDMYNLDDEGITKTVIVQRRIFRNRKDLRYINRIHEFLTIGSEDAVRDSPELKILHTGYADSELIKKQKSVRNETVLREELERSPDDLTLKGYLADALSVDSADKPERIEEADRLYFEIVESGKPLTQVTARNAFIHQINKAIRENEIERTIDLLKRAMGYMPGTPDYRFQLGRIYYVQKKYDEALSEYKQCETIIETSKALNNSMTPDNLKMMMHDMAHCCIMLEKYAEALNYTGLALIMDKYTEDTLASLFMLMKITQGAGLSSDIEAVEYLRQFYDFDDPHDKLFLAKCAKKAGDETMMIYFYKMLTEADKAFLNGTPAPYESNIVQ